MRARARALVTGKYYEIYRKENLAWGELTDLPKSIQEIVAALSLPQGETHIQERVFDQIQLDDLKLMMGQLFLWIFRQTFWK